MSIGQSMDASMQASLMVLSRAVHDAQAKGTPDSEIESLAATIKHKIDSQLIHLRGSSAELAEKISEIITNKEWAELPAPAALEMTLASINEVAAALAQVTDHIMTDIGEIMRVLMELNRKITLDNRDAQVKSNEISVKEANAAIKDRENAAWIQFGAELASSVAQFATAAVSLYGAKKSLQGTKDSIVASKNAYDMTVGKPNDKSGSLISLKEKAGVTESKLVTAEARFKEASSRLPASDPVVVEAKRSYEAAKLANSQAQNELQIKEAQVGKLERDAHNNRLTADATMQIYKAKGEISAAVVNATAGLLKVQGALHNLSADQHDINKSLAEKSYQASQEVVSSAKEVLRGLLNFVQALEQILSSLNSLLARNTA